jgi:hypothetical protein
MPSLGGRMMGMGLAHARRDRQANRKMVKTGNEMNFGAMVIGRGFGCSIKKLITLKEIFIRPFIFVSVMRVRSKRQGVSLFLPGSLGNVWLAQQLDLDLPFSIHA